MMHEIGVELQARLRVQGCRYPVLDREPTGTATYRNAIVIEHDRDASDALLLPLSQRINPKHRYRLAVAGKLTIYAQSTSAGAQLFEHENLAYAVVEQVLVGLDHVMHHALRRQRWSLKDARFVEPQALEGTERPGGAQYVIKFLVERAIRDVTMTGAAKPEFTLGADGIRSTTKVSYANGQTTTVPPADAETACGGEDDAE